MRCSGNVEWWGRLSPTILGLAVVDFPVRGGGRRILKPESKPKKEEEELLATETGDHNTSGGTRSEV